MRTKKILSVVLATAMMSALFTGCGSKGTATDADVNTSGSSATDADVNTSGSSKSEENSGDIKEFTAFFAVPGSEINDDNEIQQKIAELTGAKVKETWLTGQTAQEAVGTLIAGGEYPDFIDGGDGMVQLYDAGALVPLDEYIDKYPNIKEFLTEEEWDRLRQDDGHIYWIQQFGNIYGEFQSSATEKNYDVFPDFIGIHNAVCGKHSYGYGQVVASAFLVHVRRCQVYDDFPARHVYVYFIRRYDISGVPY